VGTFDCTGDATGTGTATSLAVTVNSTGSSRRHITFSGKTGGEGQLFEHLLREVFKRMNTSSRRVFTQYA
jgi:hypothetical protein